jgi:hypothetical protein
MLRCSLLQEMEQRIWGEFVLEYSSRFLAEPYSVRHSLLFEEVACAGALLVEKMKQVLAHRRVFSLRGRFLPGWKRSAWPTRTLCW